MDTKNSTPYRYYDLTLSFDGTLRSFFGLCAIDLPAAIADVTDAYGPGELTQWGVRDYPSMFTCKGCSSVQTGVGVE